MKKILEGDCRWEAERQQVLQSYSLHSECLHLVMQLPFQVITL